MGWGDKQRLKRGGGGIKIAMKGASEREREKKKRKEKSMVTAVMTALAETNTTQGNN